MPVNQIPGVEVPPMFDSISSDPVLVHEGTQLQVKLSGPTAELNVCLDADDVARLEGQDAPPVIPVTAGTSAGTKVHWTATEGDLYILVGEDAETWDIAFVCEPELFRTLVEQLRQPR